MKEMRNDSPLARVFIYVGVLVAVIGAVWYLYKACKVLL